MEHILFEFLLRSSLIAGMTGLVLWALRIRSAAARHAAWTGVMLSMLVLPAWMLWGPKASLPVLPAQPTVIVDLAPAISFDAPIAPPVETAPARSHWHWSTVPLGVYFLGALALLLRLAIGTLRATRLTRFEVSAPVTVGLLRPRIILPESALDWPREQLDAVMAHEREHVRRRDPLFQWLALFNRAMFWFHPLAWWLELRLAALAEEACDAVVIESGHDPREYSLLLLDLARTVERAGARVNVVAMAMPGVYLPQRIRNIVAGVSAPRVSRTRLMIASLVCAIPAALFAAGTLDRMRQVLPLPLPERPLPQPPQLLAQARTAPQPAPTPKLDFEAATVKPAAPLNGQGALRAGGPGTSGPTSVNYRYRTLKTLLMTAYDLPINQVLGPGWLDSAYFDIEAKVAPGATKEQVGTMLQNLLTDRFKLVVHRENRELPVYELVIAKGGPKLKAYVEDPNEAPLEPGKLNFDKSGVPRLAAGNLLFTATPEGKRVIMARKSAIGGSPSLAVTLAAQLGRPVIDKTGLTGFYDYTVEFKPGPNSPSFGPPPSQDTDGPDLTTAIEEQLGLKLEAKKEPVEVLVVDSGERTPVEN